MFYRRNADTDLRELQRRADAGDIEALRGYIQKCIRAGKPVEFKYAVPYAKLLLEEAITEKTITYDHLLLLVVEAREIDVVIKFNDKFYQDYQFEINDPRTDWYLLPDIMPELEAKGIQIGYYYPGKEIPELLIYGQADSGNALVSEEQRKSWDVNFAKYLEIEEEKTYADIVLVTLNPAHMCYGNCNCVACIVHECGACG